MIRLFNQDCLAAMRAMPDKAYELAIVDPPYGLGDTLINGGTWSVKYKQKGVQWDIAPTKEYFEQLRRVSVNQIIWGGNYFVEHLNPARCFIVWVKPNILNMHTMADCEIALTSFDKNAKIINLSSLAEGQRIHICQKPVKLYEWLLKNYAKPGDRILDTHGGSASIALACYNMGFDLDLYEIDKDYYEAAVKRLEAHKRQGTLFQPQEVYG